MDEAPEVPMMKVVFDIPMTAMTVDQASILAQTSPLWHYSTTWGVLVPEQPKKTTKRAAKRNGTKQGE